MADRWYQFSCKCMHINIHTTKGVEKRTVENGATDKTVRTKLKGNKIIACVGCWSLFSVKRAFNPTAFA